MAASRQRPSPALGCRQSVVGCLQAARFVDEVCELQVPDHRLGEIAVQQTVGMFQVANEQPDDQDPGRNP
jgi:hypothetical protein